MSEIYPCKESIDETEKLQLIGLLVLAKRHNDALKDICTAVRNIVGQKDDRGHCDDAVYGEYSVEELLELMDVTVLPSPGQ